MAKCFQSGKRSWVALLTNRRPDPSRWTDTWTACRLSLKTDHRWWLVYRWWTHLVDRRNISDDASKFWRFLKRQLSQLTVSDLERWSSWAYFGRLVSHHLIFSLSCAIHLKFKVELPVLIRNWFKLNCIPNECSRSSPADQWLHH